LSIGSGRQDWRGLGVSCTEAVIDAARWYAACLELWMFTMLTAPALTLVFLGVVVGLGVAFVWMLWEIERTSKPRRNSDRFG
jgi:hypothetical protein